MKKSIMLAAAIAVILNPFQASAGWKTSAVTGIGLFVLKDFTKACLKDAQCRTQGVTLAIAGLTVLVQKYGPDAVTACIQETNCLAMAMAAVTSGGNVIAYLDKGDRARNAPPPGNCGEFQISQLNDEVDRQCKNFERGEISCKKGQDVETMMTKMAKADNCADARIKRENLCFNGGNKGHKKAIKQMRNTSKTCGDLIMKAKR
jgi:DNA-binding FrmR family transcriptional regulator